jgi:CubicO group peptidase (beta-lactamase class C family)
MDINHVPGAATWISKNGQVIWEQCYGYANLEDSIAVTDTTSFMLASISKTVVGTAIMQLWERGEFELDDDINDYLPFNVRNPYYPDSAITFQMLMTHTSSIHDNWSMIPLPQPGDPTMPLGELCYEYLVPGGIYYSTFNFSDSVPGVYYDYCNAAIGLLGYLVEEMEDSFPIHCRDSIFDPLGMNHTSWFLAGLDTNNIAVRYHWTGTYNQPLPHIGHPGYPAGYLKSSMLDLAQHLTAIMQNGIVDTVRILDSATVDLILSPHFSVTTNFNMGLTWRYENVGGRLIWYHMGNTAGVSTLCGFSPAESSAIIILTNGESYYGFTIPVTLACFSYAAQYGIEELELSHPVSLILQVNPNPFRHTTQIRYSILDTRYPIQIPTLSIYDAAGRPVKSFDHELCIVNRASTISWDGTDHANRQLGCGVYFLKPTAGNYTGTEKLLLIR